MDRRYVPEIAEDNSFVQRPRPADVPPRTDRWLASNEKMRREAGRLNERNERGDGASHERELLDLSTWYAVDTAFMEDQGPIGAVEGAYQ
jgi:hypothetical protein